MKLHSQIRKSSSVSSLKYNKIDFNPNEFSIGNSKIDKLPIQVRRHSQPINQIQSPEVMELRRRNEKLIKENLQLKKKLENQMYQRVQMLKKDKKCYDEPTRTTNNSDYKSTFLSKMNSRSKCPTQCQTGLYGSKFSINEQNIPDLYELWRNKGIIPEPNKLISITRRYFEQFQQIYFKLKVMVQSLQWKSLTNSPDHQYLQNFLTLLKVPIIYQKKPDLLARSISKEKFKSGSKEVKKMSKSKICPEMKSAQQTVKIIQNLLEKATKSQTITKLLSENHTIRKIWKKIMSN